MIRENDMKIADILDHPLFESSKEIPKIIHDNIKGRVCLTSYLHALYIVKKLMGDECRVYVEIGTLFGGSISLVMQDETKTKFVGIDMFDGFYGLPKDPFSKLPVTIETTQKNIEKNNTHGHDFELVKGSSFHPRIIEYIEQEYPVIDLLFIDGDHSDSGVVKDFVNYSGFVRQGGILVFDNYGDPCKKGVKRGVSTLDLSGWATIGQYGYSLYISKL